MAITLHGLQNGIYRVDIGRVLLNAEFARAERALAVEITRLGPIKLLVVLNESFEGLERRGHWDQASFYEAHGDDISRIAIVGPERWRGEMLMFAAAGLRKGPVEFFPEGGTVNALAWLSS